MVAFPVGVVDSVAPTITGGVLLQTIDPTGLFEASRAVRASVTFVVVLVLGSTYLWRFDSFVERSVDASMARPLSSVGYGLVAHMVVGFGTYYLATRLSQFRVSGLNAGGVGLVLGLGLVLLAGGLGFTVVGSSLVELAGEPGRWTGPLVGALVAGGVALVEPAVAAIVWTLVVSVGIGGAIRRWHHASVTGDT